MEMFSRIHQARSPADADLVRKAQTDGIYLPNRANPDAGNSGSVLQRLPSQALDLTILDGENYSTSAFNSVAF